MELSNSKIKSGAFILLVLLLLPLCFINLNNFHDWGDDFAQYLLQSEYFSGKINEIPVSDVAGYSPTGKGVLFSLLLIPITSFSDQILLSGKVFISLSLMFSSILFYLFLGRKFNHVLSIIVATSFAYNYHVLQLKDQILPDFLFTGMLIAVMWLLSIGKQKYYLLAICLAVISLLLKSSGIVLVLAMIIYFITPQFGFEASFRYRMKLILVLVATTIVAFIIEYLLISGTPGPAWYMSISIEKISLNSVAQNLAAYTNAVTIYFEQEVPWIINKIIKYIALLGIFGGFIQSVASKRSAIEIFVVLYFLLLLLYPYPYDPVRFIIPLLPFLLFYLFSFYKIVFHLLTSNNSSKLLIMLAIALAGSQIITTKKEIQKVYNYGPFTTESQQMISFTKNNIPETDTISCSRPWAVAWFTGRRTIHSSSTVQVPWILVDNSKENAFESHSETAIVFSNNNHVIKHSK